MDAAITSQRSALARHGRDAALALACLVAALALRLALEPVLELRAPFITFFLAVTVAAWFAGLWAGLACTVGGLLLGNYLFTSPRYGLIVEDPVEWVNSLVFGFGGILISVLSEQRLRSLARERLHVRQLQRLASELALLEHRQRAGFAQTLHDHLQQLLVAAQMRVGVLAQAVPPDAAEQARAIESLLRDSLAYTRSLTADLNPPVLRDPGLASAMRWLVEESAARHQLRVAVTVPEADPAPALTEPVKLFVFQATRELLFNVVKHAGIGEADVRLAYDAERLTLEVSDRGRGVDPVPRPPRPLRADRGDPGGGTGLGLRSIRERAESFGGSFTTRSRPGEGTTHTLSLPLALPA